MKHIRFLVLFISILTTGCFISDSLMNDFKQINVSLEKSNKFIRLRNGEAMYAVLHKADKQTYLRADTLAKLNAETCDYIDSLKSSMERYDPKGDNINIPHEFLVNTFKGIWLQQKIANVYTYAHAIMPNSGKVVSKDTLEYELHLTTVDTAWTRKYFGSIPTTVAICSLSKTENNCLKLEEKVLAYLKKGTINKLT
ncbi:GldM-like protein [Mucilaginibacter gracilis]|uniref:GldM-like protein n=1 Tax=Mucilaginibacter gracilis TaxID=423350 RepID=A0A495J222_9SPHI|nr:hypothetical protein [Mucilaginibacter gracilis]RKR83026.1 GldM-like protein [Mucilaginibacter gracilis]